MHTGLYDGTGYGRGSSASTDSTRADDAAAKKADFVKQYQEKLRLQEDSASPPATAAAETVASCADVPGSFPSDEVESSKIEGKL
jgi:translation initiation factor 4G